MGFTFVEGGSDGQNTGTAISLDPALSASPTDGDLVVAVIHTNNASDSHTDATGSGATFSAYTGYDQVNSTYGDSDSTYSVFWKIASSEPTNYTFNYGTSNRAALTVMVFTPDTGDVVEDADGTNYDATSDTNIPVSGITVANNSVAIAIGLMDRNVGGGTADNSYLGTLAPPNQAIRMAYRLFSTGVPTGTTTFSPTASSDESFGIHISFSEGAASPLTVIVPTGPLR
jgi:hypothetical protein